MMLRHVRSARLQLEASIVVLGLTLALFFLIIPGTTSSSFTQTTSSSWPVFEHDAQHTSLSSFPGPSNNLTKWIIGLGGIGSSPVIGQDGKIYVVSDNLYLYALNPDGSLIWSSYIGEKAYTPAIDSNGLIYVPTIAHIVAFFPDGVINWRLALPALNVGTSLTVGRNGNIYSVDSGTVIAVSPIGQVVWSVITECTYSSAAVDKNGTVYCGGSGTKSSNLYAINPDGSIRWNMAFGAPDNAINLAPTIGPDGTIYVGSKNGTLYAISSGSGIVEWKYQTHVMESGVAVGPDGTVYAAGTRLYAFLPTGFLKWFANCVVRNITGGCEQPLGIVAGMAVDSRSAIYAVETLTDGSSDLVAFDSTGNVSWHYKPSQFGERILSPPSIDANGTIYFGTRCALSSCGGNAPGGRMYAVGRSPNSPILTVSEVNLPNGTAWTFSLDGRNYFTNCSYITFATINGTHVFLVPPAYHASYPGVRYFPITEKGSLNISGGGVTYSVGYSKQYSVSFGAYPPIAGKTNITGTNWYYPNSTVAISSSAFDGYRFSSYRSSSNSIVIQDSSSQQTSLLVNRTGTVQAIFYVGVTISSHSGGTVSFSDPPVGGTVQSGTSTVAYFPYGTLIHLTAIQSNGYLFVGWSEGSSSTSQAASLLVTVTLPTSLTANFVPTSVSATSSALATTPSSSSSASHTSQSTTTISVTQSATASSSSRTEPNQNVAIESFVIVAIVAIAGVAFLSYRSLRHRLQQ